MSIKEFKKIINAKHGLNEKINTGYALHILVRHFLGDDWYTVYNDDESINIDIVESILSKTQSFTLKSRFKSFFSGCIDVIRDFFYIIFYG